MNPSQAPPPDDTQPGTQPPGGTTQGSFPSYPANWREALLALISSRIALIQIEARDAARQCVGRLLLLAVALATLMFAWALMLAGSIAWLASATGWSWHLIALAAAAAHFTAAIVLLNRAKRPAPPAFPVTRAEFQKDQSWIENFQTTRKS